jgi:hypothetical protein
MTRRASGAAAFAAAAFAGAGTGGVELTERPPR